MKHTKQVEKQNQQQPQQQKSQQQKTGQASRTKNPAILGNHEQEHPETRLSR